MRRVRLTAAMLALLTGLITILFWFMPEVGLETIVCTTVAAACLAIASMFEANEPPARKRMVVVCALFVLLIGVAAAFVLLAPAERAAPMGALAMLAACGLGLTIWSFGIRNRVSRPQWRDYFDR